MANKVEIETGPVPAPPSGLDAIIAAARKGGRGMPPVHLWNPPFCGDIGLKITRDGAWHYQGSPIGRPAMVRLFASILRRDPERFVLVTPVEKVAVEVEDAPFLAVEMNAAGEGPARTLKFRTNVDDWVEAGPDHPLRFDPGPSGGIKPYVRVRGDLWALATRALYYELVALAELRLVEGRSALGVASAGQFFVICDGDDIEGLE